MGEQVPDRILNAPSLDTSLAFYYDAFFDLTSERQVGFGEGPIPTTAILRYASHYEMDSLEESDLLFFVRRLDNAYLEHQSSKAKRKGRK